MREIKFRGWDKALKNMSYSNLHSISFDGTLNYGNADFGKYPMQIMQFTGIKDKNNKELYEGDICSGNWPYAKKCMVKWIDKRGMFLFVGVAGEGLGESGRAAYDMGYKLNSAKIEIIGNIYENPELLK